MTRGGVMANKLVLQFPSNQFGHYVLFHTCDLVPKLSYA